MRIELSVIVPAFNEADRICASLQRIDDYLNGSTLTYEVVVVDDGSSDRTAEVVAGVAAERPAIRLIRYDNNRGKGNAVRLGMLSARGVVRLMCDADCSTPPEEMPKLYGLVMAGETDIAIGSRYAAGASVAQEQPRWRVMWSRLCNLVIQKSLVGGISDTQCGFKAFSAEAAQLLFSQARIDGWAFDLEILALAREHGLSVEEVPVHWSDDPRSKVNPIKDAWRVIKEWHTIRTNLRRGVYSLPEPAAASFSGMPRWS